jgi:hypothetical protein
VFRKQALRNCSQCIVADGHMLHTHTIFFIASGVGLSPLYCGHFWPMTNSNPFVTPDKCTESLIENGNFSSFKILNIFLHDCNLRFDVVFKTRTQNDMKTSELLLIVTHI